MGTKQRMQAAVDAIEAVLDAIDARATGAIDSATTGYVTEGGTYVLASSPLWNDDGEPHDLVAIFPVPLEGSRVAVLRPTVNPAWIAQLRAALDVERVES